MTKSKSYIINIDPIAWQRAGVYANRFYDKQKHDKLAVGLYLQQQHGTLLPFSKPFILSAKFFISIPRSVCNRMKDWNCICPPPLPPHGCECIPCERYPDIDNLLKFILDTAQSANIITNDKLCVSLRNVDKFYSAKPRTEITLAEYN